MNTNRIAFHCPNCLAKIKAPIQLGGCKRTCPGCRHAFRVPGPLPKDAGPVLVFLDAAARLNLGVHGANGLARRPVWGQA